MEELCNIPMEFMPFKLFGYCLQEPSGFLSDLLIAIVALFIFFKLPKSTNDFYKNWKRFFLLIGISTFLGGFSHLLYYYTGDIGKLISWCFAFAASFYSGKAMITLIKEKTKIYKIAQVILYVKLIVLLILTIIYVEFLYVTADSVITYLFYCLGIAIYHYRQQIKSFRFFIIGVLLLVPSVFIFIFEISPSRWLTKNDLSHILIAITLTFFYLGIKKLSKSELDSILHKSIKND